MQPYRIIQPTLPHEKGTFLAVADNYRALTWCSAPGHKEIINITSTR